jgi:hypothetical protein
MGRQSLLRMTCVGVGELCCSFDRREENHNIPHAKTERGFAQLERVKDMPTARNPKIPHAKPFAAQGKAACGAPRRE